MQDNRQTKRTEETATGLMGECDMRYLRKKRILSRLIGVYVILCFVPILSLSVYFHNFYRSSVTEKVGKTNADLMTLLDDVINVELDKLQYFSDAIAMRDSLQSGLESAGGSGVLSRDEKILLEAELGSMSAISDMVKGIYIFDNKGNEVFRMGYYFFTPSEADEMMKETMERTPLEYIVAQHLENGSDNILIWRNIYSKEVYRKHLGCLVLIVDEDILAARCYENLDPGEEGKLFICRDDGMVLSSKTEDFIIGETLAPELTEQLLNREAIKRIYSTVEYEGREYIVNLRYNYKSGGYEILMTSEKGIRKELSTMKRTVIITAALWAAASVLALVIISGTIVIPIKQLVHYTEEIDEGKDAFIQDNSQDEIGLLTRKVVRSISQIKEFQKAEAENNQRRREQEISILQAQIQPHFLFNILNTFKWMAAINGVPALETGLAALAKLLRNNIMGKEEQIFVKEELDNVRNYIYIQSLMYGNKINFQVNAEEELLNVMLPKLLLQPVVENSILHGIRDNGETLNITVGIRQEEKKCVLCFTDDGRGFSPEEKELETEKKKKVNGIGMENVKERIHLCYGAAGSFQVESHPGAGTQVLITIPM